MNMNRRDFLKGVVAGAFTAESGREIITKTYELSQSDPERKKTISQIAETFRLEASQVESIVKIVGKTTTKISAETPDSLVTFFYEEGVIKVIGEIKKDPEKSIPNKKSGNNKIRS